MTESNLQNNEEDDDEGHSIKKEKKSKKDKKEKKSKSKKHKLKRRESELYGFKITEEDAEVHINSKKNDRKGNQGDLEDLDISQNNFQKSGQSSFFSKNKGSPTTPRDVRRKEISDRIENKWMSMGETSQAGVMNLNNAMDRDDIKILVSE